MWQNIIGIIIAVLLVALLARQYFAVTASERAKPSALFRRAASIVENPVISAGEAAGTYCLNGRYKNHAIQVKVIADTLAVRKLPSLWLMVTIPERLPVSATFDMMMRPTGPTSFSNFDLLPVALEKPAGFPDHAVIRTDDPEYAFPVEITKPHLGPFFGRQGKELLITPKGIRMVLLLAEGDRARYGVFRQADFGEADVDPATLRDTIERLLDLREAIENWHNQTS